MKVKKYIKITRADERGSYVQPMEEVYSAIDGEFMDGTLGSKITLELLEMTDTEYEKLPEFTGW